MLSSGQISILLRKFYFSQKLPYQAGRVRFSSLLSSSVSIVRQRIKTVFTQNTNIFVRLVFLYEGGRSYKILHINHKSCTNVIAFVYIPFSPNKDDPYSWITDRKYEIVIHVICWKLQWVCYEKRKGNSFPPVFFLTHWLKTVHCKLSFLGQKKTAKCDGLQNMVIFR